MHITFVDDSFPFDGYSPTSQPLSGPEKAFASLPSALAMRGHEVVVFNRCTFPVRVDGASWHPWESDRPARTDVLVAFRRPRLLEFLPGAVRRVLWTAGPPEELDQPAARALLARYRPTVIFFTTVQRDRWANPLGLPVRVVEPGLAAAYVEDLPMMPAEPPRAVSTAHPLAGLDWLIALWRTHIRPAVPNAELHLYSALLDKGRLGADLPDAVRPILKLAVEAQRDGVIIQRPQADPQMAEIYRAARVHVYPGQPHEVLASTLAESQAAGLPGIARAVGPAVLARIVDGQTGKITTADGNFASAAIDLLSDRGIYERMSANARLLQRGRTWPIAAAEFEGALA
ncbi:MAG TPA: glycosyltransferase [Alphaproteobacteria bacterium]